MRFRDTAFVSLALIFLFTSAVNAQQHFEEGIVVFAGGDRMYGLIDYGDWDKNPNHFQFKKAMYKHAIAIYPEDIQGFYVAGEHYVSAQVQVETSPDKLTFMSRRPHFSYDTVTTFLRAIVEGKKSLFSYKDQDAKNHFYIQQDGKWVLLKYKKYLKKAGGKSVVGVNRAYVGQLINYFDAGDAIVSRINKSAYTSKSLKSLFGFYYAAKNERPEFQRKAEKILLRPGVLLGLSTTFLDFKSSVFPLHDRMTLSPATHVTAGLSLACIMPHYHRKWSLNSELLYVGYRTKGAQDNISRLEFAQSYLKLNQTLRYTVPYGNKHVFAQAGISGAIVLSETNTQEVDNGLSSLLATRELPILPQTDGYEFEFFLGGGMLWQRFSLEGRYEFGDGPSRLLYMRSPMNRFYLMLGYRLGK